MSARDYAAFVARLRRDFPDEPFLIVRFGDHQPMFAKQDHRSGARRCGDRAAYRWRPTRAIFTTYYAIDAINFRPVDLVVGARQARCAYLPLVVLEAAGVPLDPSFAEQKRILRRCGGLFYRCAGGAEVRRFNRLLIDAGLIKGSDGPAYGQHETPG